MIRLAALLLVATASIAQSVKSMDQTFEFRSGFWINLDHYLREQATLKIEPLDAGPAWSRALAYYRKTFIGQDLPSGEVVDLDNKLSSLGNAPNLKNSGLKPELVAVLESAAPVYRKRWWRAHDRTNREWVAAADLLLVKYSTAMQRDLAKVYGVDWPTTPLRTDVAHYANWAGAYTYLDPDRITISSEEPADRGLGAIEMLFHEASHTQFKKLLDAMGDESRAQNRLYRRRDLWHAVLFYTAGTITERNIPGYTQFGLRDSFYERSWPGALEVMNTGWKPYLDGKSDLTTAIRSLLAGYGVAR